MHNIASYFWKDLDMINVPLAQAKNHLSELTGRVERGETVAVTRRGKPVVHSWFTPLRGHPGKARISSDNTFVSSKNP